MKKVLAIPLLAVMLLAAAVVAPATAQETDGGVLNTAASVVSDVADAVGLETETAAAEPRWCWTTYVNNRNAYSECSGGSGYHRVHVYCKRLWAWGGFWRSGPAKTVTRESWASCPWGTVITWAGESKW